MGGGGGMGWAGEDTEVHNIFVLFMLPSVQFSLCFVLQTIIIQARNEFIVLGGTKEGGVVADRSFVVDKPGLVSSLAGMVSSLFLFYF